MAIRNLLRYVGLMCILLVFVVRSLSEISTPTIAAATLAKSNLPEMLSIFGLELGPNDYILFARTVGVISLSCSLFMLLGVGRSFFAMVLAAVTVILTVACHLDIHDPSNTPPEQQHHLLKNISVVGALLFVAGSGHPSRQYNKARAAAERTKKDD